jgi:hypothetical protein
VIRLRRPRMRATATLTRPVMTAPLPAKRRPTGRCHEVRRYAGQRIRRAVPSGHPWARSRFSSWWLKERSSARTSATSSGTPERGETRPSPGLHAFVLRGTLDVVVIGHGSPVIRTRNGAAGRRAGPCPGDRGERGAKEDRDRDAEDDLGRELRRGVELKPDDGGQHEGSGEGRENRPRLHRTDCGKGRGGLVDVTGDAHAMSLVLAGLPDYGAR